MERCKIKKEIVGLLLRQNLEEHAEEELMELLLDNPIAVDIDKQEETNLTFGEKIADRISEVAGSWGFILGFSGFLVFWIVLNTVVFKNNPADPYPFILLNLCLSCVAALQAPIIMMSQNRQAKKDSLRGHNDYRVDLKSELILEELYHNIEILAKNQKKILTYIDEQQAKELKKTVK